MNRHLSDDETLSYAAGEMDRQEHVFAARHLADCGACRERIERSSRGLAALASLPLEAHPARELWSGIEARLEPPAEVRELRGGALGQLPRRSAATLLRVAAVLLIFAAGAATGRWTAPGRAPFSSSDIDAASEGRAADVQHAGSQYAGALAIFASTAGVRSPAEIAQARAAAYATIYAAARELAALAPDDPWAATLLDLAERGRTDSSTPPSGVAF